MKEWLGSKVVQQKSEAVVDDVVVSVYSRDWGVVRLYLVLRLPFWDYHFSRLDKAGIPYLSPQPTIMVAAPEVDKKQAVLAKISSIADFSSEIRFYLNGTEVIVDANTVDPASTLLDFLRSQKRLTGTKLGCAHTPDCTKLRVADWMFDIKAAKGLPVR